MEGCGLWTGRGRHRAGGCPGGSPGSHFQLSRACSGSPCPGVGGPGSGALGLLLQLSGGRGGPRGRGEGGERRVGGDQRLAQVKTKGPKLGRLHEGTHPNGGEALARPRR